MVLDAFFLNALLRDKAVQGKLLQLPHHGAQNQRFDAQLSARNMRMAGTGQEMWAHACDECMHIYRGEDGQLCKHSG